MCALCFNTGQLNTAPCWYAVAPTPCDDITASSVAR